MTGREYSRVMRMELILELSQRMAVIALMAFVLVRARAFRHSAGAGRPRDRWLLAVLFGLIAIAGTYMGVPIQGAIANSRVVGAAVGGLLGGPRVGLLAGLIGGAHRYALGGFTALSCGLSTLLEGLLAGWIHNRVGPDRLDWRVGFATGFIAEVFQMVIILAISRPFSAALELVQAIAIPMTLVNAAGVAMFVLIIRDALAAEERIASFHTQKVLQIATATLPYLRRGLDMDSARRVAQIIFLNTGASAVALTDHTRILAHVGAGAEHHPPGSPVHTAASRKALETGMVQVCPTRADIGCERADCPLAAGLVMPLQVRGQIVGTLKIYRDEEFSMSPQFVELATGMAGLFSTQLELAELERQAQMATRAELKALRAQINPHFLFNALNTISAFVRMDPERARELLAHLSDFFRRTLRRNEELVSVAEELELVECYLTIERARFGGRLQVVVDLAPAVLRQRIPPFTLQPLVENALKYGLLPRAGGGTVRVEGRLSEGTVRLTVSDDGEGMDPEVAAAVLAGRAASRQGSGIGLSNVNERLKGHFGPGAALQIRSRPGAGTAVSLCLPAEEVPRVLQ